MLCLLRVDLLTGVFVLSPLARLDKRPGVSTEPGPVGQKLAGSVARTLGYAKYGLAGWFTIFVRGMPIFVSFCMTFDHSVVNMFLFPSAPRGPGERRGPRPPPLPASLARRAPRKRCD